MPPYIWMPPGHIQHKESMLFQTKGVSICPIHLDVIICLDAPPVCLDAPICLDGLLYVWMPPYVWMPTCMFGHPPCLHSPYVWMPPYVWTPLCMVGCPHMFGHSPVCFDALHIFGHPTVCLDAAKCMVASKGMRDIQTAFPQRSFPIP